ncbi:aluminum-activated malate transporter 8-like [Corylus avellana]|uniref:aluminum-activated malate transporter 8-like n=1 Tax=Corylus avellana TaxID=13451 RepID=UPI001E1FA9E1|nr:aluminum-activated malate transporter 8-like [Corylus avellana]
MTIESQNDHENAWGLLKALPEKLWGKVVDVAEKIKKFGEDDPRRITHSLKVGLAVTLISLFYYIRPLYDGFGANSMWAVFTVILVCEFSVGATLGKGLNRMLATLSAGALGIGVHSLATLSGDTGRPIILGFFVFLIAATVTFARFIPAMKARYDYGLMIFILTFSLISVSSYRENDQLLVMAYQRLTTIVVGSFTAIVICICIRPVWIGENLNNLVANNMEKLGKSLEGFGGEYFNITEEGPSMDDKSFLQGYKSVLTSQETEESMANLARWEVWHFRFGFQHPWKQYLKIGTLCRQCAYKVDALNSYLNTKIQFQTPSEFQSKIQEPCTKICSESGQALKELALGLKKVMNQPTSVNLHIERSKMAAENLKSLLNTTSLWENDNLQLIIPTGAVALILVDIVPYIEKISEALHELASLAHFKRVDARVSP